MPGPAIFEDPPPVATVPAPRAVPITGPTPEEVLDRVHQLEDDVAELRGTVSNLAEVVLGNLKDRRESEDASPPTIGYAPIDQTLKVAAAVRKPWLLWDFLKEMGLTLRMYVDSRYRVRRSTQLMVPAMLALFVATYLAFNYTPLDLIPIVKQVGERMTYIVLAILLYKIVIREVVRYREALLAYTTAAKGANPSASSSVVHVDSAAPVTRQEME